MAHASRRLRKTRRLKRERTLAFKLYNLTVAQRDQARMIASALNDELKKYTDDPFPEDAPTTPTGTITGTSAFSVTKLDDPTTEGM